MSITQKVTGYIKQFAGEVAGDQALHDEGRREVGQADAGYREENEQVMPVEPVATPGSVISAETGRETVVGADAVPRYETSTAGPMDARASREDVVITGGMNANPAAPVANYSDPDQLKLYRLVPLAASGDLNWDLAPNQGEVVVRARSSGDARVVAAEAELDFLEVDALPGEGNSTTSASAFRSEKLYTVVDETDPSYPLEGPRGVVAGTVRVDNIRPTEL
jgi:hypothetical protein